MREEVISKLDKPLEKMRIKELKQLLQVCMNACQSPNTETTSTISQTRRRPPH